MFLFPPRVFVFSSYAFVLPLPLPFAFDRLPCVVFCPPPPVPSLSFRSSFFRVFCPRLFSCSPHALPPLTRVGSSLLYNSFLFDFSSILPSLLLPFLSHSRLLASVVSFGSSIWLFARGWRYPVAGRHACLDESRTRKDTYANQHSTTVVLEPRLHFSAKVSCLRRV